MDKLKLRKLSRYLFITGVVVLLAGVILGDVILGNNSYKIKLGPNEHLNTVITASESVALEVQSPANLYVKGGSVYTVGKDLVVIPTNTSVSVEVGSSNNGTVISVYSLGSYLYPVFGLILLGGTLILSSFVVAVYTRLGPH